MIEKDYLTLKSLADKFEGEFTEEASGRNFQTLQHLAQEQWLTKRPSNGLWLWWVTYEGKEALEDYSRLIETKRSAARAEIMAFIALVISALALWRSW